MSDGDILSLHVFYMFTCKHTESGELFSLCSMATVDLSKINNNYIMFADVFAKICGFRICVASHVFHTIYAENFMVC